MKKRILTIIFGVFMALVWAAGAVAELSGEEFIRQFLEAVKKEDKAGMERLFQENPETAKQIVQEMRKEDDPNITEMDRLNEEAEKYWLASRYPEAIAKLEEGLKLAKKSNDKKYIGRFLGNIGIMYQNLGQYEKALSHYEQALAIHKEIGDRRGNGKIKQRS